MGAHVQINRRFNGDIGHAIVQIELTRSRVINVAGRVKLRRIVAKGHQIDPNITRRNYFVEKPVHIARIEFLRHQRVYSISADSKSDLRDNWRLDRVSGDTRNQLRKRRTAIIDYGRNGNTSIGYSAALVPVLKRINLLVGRQLEAKVQIFYWVFELRHKNLSASCCQGHIIMLEDAD